MFSLGGITFLTPWLLAALAAIPVLWWLLRVMPPRPRGVKFPAFFLLKDLRTDMKTAAHTPWWLLLLRSAIVACVILAFADPVLRLSGALPGGDAPLLVAVDNGWAAAAHWNERLDKLKEYVTQCCGGRTRRRSSAPRRPKRWDGKVHAYGPMERDGRGRIRVDHLKNQNLAAVAPTAPPADVVRRTDLRAQRSLPMPFTSATARRMTRSDTKLMSVVQGATGGADRRERRDDTVNAPLISCAVRQAKPGDAALHARAPRTQAWRPTTGHDRSSPIPPRKATCSDIPQVQPFRPARGEVDVTWRDMLRRPAASKVTRFRVERANMASAVSFTDSQWQQHPVGIVADPSRKENAGFLNEVYYLRRALEVNGVPEIDQPGVLLQKSLSAIIWPDSAALTSIGAQRPARPGCRTAAS